MKSHYIRQAIMTILQLLLLFNSLIEGMKEVYSTVL